MASPRQSAADRQADRERAILDAAAAVFTRAGYHGATMRAIAAHAGVATGTLYLYFPSKEGVFLALVDRLEQLVLGAIMAARAGAKDTLSKLEASIHGAISVFAHHRDLARIVLVQAAGASPEFESRLRTVHDAFADFVRHELDEAVAGGLIPPLDTRVAARAWVGTFYEVIMAWLSQPPLADAASAAALLAAVPALARYNLRAIGADRDGAGTSTRGPEP